MGDNKTFRVNVQTSTSKKINVTSNVSENYITASPDTGLYWSRLSENWAIGEGLVQGKDYSSKTYATQAKAYADESKLYSESASLDLNNVVNTINEYNSQLGETVNTGVEQLETTTATGLASITTTETTAIANIQAIENAGVQNLTNTKDDVLSATSTSLSQITTQANTSKTEITTTKNNALSEMATSRQNALSDINATLTEIDTVKTNAVNAVKAEGQTQLNNVKSTGFYMRDDKLYFINSKGVEEEFKSGGGGGLPMFAPIWSDHLYNDASYLRADTFSWHDASIYVTGYNIIEAEYNDENCIEETENGVTYRRSPNGFKIASADQEENVLNAYNTYGTAWYYIIDEVNNRFKLPRTKWGFVGSRDSVGKFIDAGLPNITGSATLHGSEAANIVYSCAGAIYGTGGNTNAYRSPANLTQASGASSYGAIHIDASKSNSTYGKSNTVQPPATQMYLYFYVGDYERPATEVNLGVLTELANGLDLNAIVGEINDVSSTGLANISNATQTGLTSVSSAVTEGVSAINETTNKGKAELNKIVADKVPPATVDNLGLVKPDGTTIAITEEGVISANIEVPEVNIATTDLAGIVKPDGSTITIAEGVISAVAQSSSEFTYSKGTNSWLMHKDGLMIQGGKVSFATGSYTTKTITFPKAFNTACVSVVLGSSNAQNTAFSWSVSSISKTSTVVAYNASSAMTIYWIAFGY